MKNFATTALLIVDLQNDFIHPDGAYARGGMANSAIAALPAATPALSRCTWKAADVAKALAHALSRHFATPAASPPQLPALPPPLPPAQPVLSSQLLLPIQHLFNF